MPIAKIAALHVRAVRVPLPEPHNTASGTVAESPLVLTDLTLDDGTVGHGLVFTYTPAALKPCAELIANLAPLVVGEPAAPLDVEQKLARRFRLLGPQGLVGIAIAAIDMALWDAVARQRGLPLCVLLGAAPKPIPVYGAVGYDGERGSAATAERWAKRGFTGVKAKIGYPTLAQDLAVVRAMRAAVGPQVAIMVDYNQSLTPTEAIERCRALDGEGLNWIEEPTLAHDYAGLAAVARAATTPIQAGENWWGTLDLQHALDAQASDYLMPDAMKISGVTGWLRASALAQPRGLRVSSHLWPELSAHLLAATPNAHWLEYADWWNPILAAPLALHGGTAVAGDAPGSGVAWNEDAVARYLF
ncbi:MAG: enolase C-terminal domain-like protein [Betaproteobacteria bacterium]